MDGGGRLTRRNRRFLKKIISTLADRDLVESGEMDGGDGRDYSRRSTRLVEKRKKFNGGDERKGGDERGGDGRKGGDERGGDKRKGGDKRGGDGQ